MRQHESMTDSAVRDGVNFIRARVLYSVSGFRTFFCPRAIKQTRNNIVIAASIPHCVHSVDDDIDNRSIQPDYRDDLLIPGLSL